MYIGPLDGSIILINFASLKEILADRGIFVDIIKKRFDNFNDQFYEE